jgi:hypothetical protein
MWLTRTVMHTLCGASFSLATVTLGGVDGGFQSGIYLDGDWEGV